jgi:phenylpropionate dioxygenase-like ring-hydroxylating dioxygenase large terminal subunit
MEIDVTETVDESKIDPSEREFGPSGISLSTYRFPTGWFIVGFSSELAAGQVKRAHYFGEELVIFRTASGQVKVLDAYCLHLGANMGVGGTVEGEHIVCPWHGWQWRGDGTNALIPYSKIGCKQNVKVKSYPVQEWYGFIVVWHERHGRAPYWQPPVLPELETDDYYPLHPHSRMLNRVKVHAQMIIENAADPYHVQFVHKADSAANTTSFDVNGDRELRRWSRGDLAHPRRSRRRQHHLRQLLPGAGHRAVPQRVGRHHRGHRPDSGRRGLHRLLLHAGIDT